MSEQPAGWALSESEQEAVAAVRSRTITPAYALRLLAASPAAGRDALHLLLDGARRGATASNGLHSLLDTERVRAAVPGVPRGAGWYEAEGFLAALVPLLDQSADVLELGCGSGRISRHLPGKVRSLVCTDVSRVMVREARKALSGHDNTTVSLTDGYSLAEFGDASFDVVLGQGVLSYFELNPALAMLAEVARVLRPGGACVFNFQCIDDEVSAARQTAHAVRAARRRTFHGGIDRPYTTCQLKRMYEAVGLCVVDVPPSPQGARTLLVARRSEGDPGPR